ncbi:hypothetical protein MBOU_18060 [Mycobacterium bourgelatii]|uniref:Uncharacterized protein n=1 Tax=Mycobacterium bourgelatii TaxID=1273442 RepID=A0A7I9YM63_MYCBU|nr:hypothetical protein MBOU_18060 [Mycobacterium bourgelatii]
MAGLVQRSEQLFDRWRLGGRLVTGGYQPKCSKSGTAGEHTPPSNDGYGSGHHNILPSEAPANAVGTTGHDP